MYKTRIITFGLASLLMATGYGCSEDSASSEHDQIRDNPQPEPNACNGKIEGDLCGSGGICFKEICLSNICTKQPLPEGTECRASVGACDLTEVCDGINTDCPEDSKKTSETVCRESAGECDLAEVCDGINTDCPEDSKKTSETVCRESAGECDLAEVCDGINTDCPEDSKKTSETVCRESVGECDTTEYCDGKSATCPDDVYEENCKSPEPPPVTDPSCEGKNEGDACGIGKECSQMLCLSGICTETPLPGGTECRAAAGDCDEAEVCDGSNFTCPEDGIKQSGTVCRPSIGGCDLPENCNGETKDCPKEDYDTDCACPADDATLGIKEDTAPRTIENFQNFILKDQDTWEDNHKAIDAFGKDKIVTMEALVFDRKMTEVTDSTKEITDKTIKKNFKAWTWNDKDRDTENWSPQGLAGTTRDSVVYRIASWTGPNSSDFVRKGRISVVKFEKKYAEANYANVILTEIKQNNEYDFAKTHAGGVAISWPYLYVSSSGDKEIPKGLRVFDLRRFVKNDTSSDCKNKMGIVGKKLCAYQYPYMLPQVGAYYYPDTQPASCSPTFSFISMDYVENEHTILSGEFRNENHEYRQYSRLIRWPIDPKTHRLVTDDKGIVTATAAWYTGKGGVQGASSHTENGKTTFYLNGFHNKDTKTDGLIVAAADAKTNTKYLNKEGKWGYAPQGMYITTTDMIWTVCEKKGEHRILFYADRKAVKP